MTWLRSLGVAISLAGLLSVQASSQEPAPPPPQGPGVSAREAKVLAEAVGTARTDVAPATLILNNRPIVTFRAEVLLRPPSIRAATAERLLNEIVDRSGTASRPGAVTSRALAGAELIAVGGRDVFAILPADLDPTGVETLPEVAQQTVARLEQALDEAIELRTPRRLLIGAGFAILATLVLLVLVALLYRIHRFLVIRAKRVAERQLERLPGAEYMKGSALLSLPHLVIRALSAAVGFVMVYSWLTFVLRLFPYTRPWGESLRGFLIERTVGMGRGIVAAMPDLFSVLLIAIIARMVSKLVGAMFDAVEQGRATLPGVYPETAQPTRRLVTALVWLFALALAYPYLPGSETDAFKGVSVFVGLMISLGSSGIVNQVMSGFTVTYSRALRVGDFVRIGEVEGTVTHIGSLSTKLKTIRQEEVTIPNAVVVSNQTTNYSRLAHSDGVYIATSVTIGYDVPWRQVKALLLLAAERTDGLRESPPPVVMQKALQDFYVEYLLLVALDNPALRGPTFDQLHGNIQDAFNEHGVQIMSPNYEADPEAPKIVPRERWFSAPAAPRPAAEKPRAV